MSYNAPDRNNQYPYLTIFTRGKDGDYTASIKAAWTQLLNEDRDLALKLAEYCFYRGGFGFSPKTYSNIMPNAVKKALPNYVHKLNNYSSSIIESHVDRMITQFKLHENIGIKSLKNGMQPLPLETIFSSVDINALTKRSPISINPEYRFTDSYGNTQSVYFRTGIYKASLNGKIVYIAVNANPSLNAVLIDKLGGDG